ncbi:tRNA-t(6)A37 methylthiotransferase [Acidisarcina polymorpha]|uniref:tRNA-t(6)A37 methylthiotransferase n=1 Tax=Acidisarcina polymorpha TaxID=2211140 RepID=A0A2Z5G667_9BACT|nr:tRNA-t(6)A37 methylthiotransferase [Acidisarcina polymorpha]
MAEYHVENFGCRASRADGEAIASRLRDSGVREAGQPGLADVVIVNTCSVTEEADRSARAYLRRIRRENPKARVVVTGCYAQRAPEELAALPGVHAVIGNSHKSRVVEAAIAQISSSDKGSGAFVPLNSLRPSSIESGAASVSIWHDPLFAHSELAALPFASDAHQTRPNLKIQDGCGNRCSFCIIPTTRGSSRSVNLKECLRAVEGFAAQGGQELVLSGINLGRWGRDLSPATRLEELVGAILEKTSLPRLRISSVEPMDWSADLIALFRMHGQDRGGGGPRLARHAHLPLQSGSDAILRAMHRRYRPWHYAAKLEEIRSASPGAAIGADVMIGFPGETDSLFAQTYDFIDRLPFTYLHVFPFSARPGTQAFAWHQSTPSSGNAVKERKIALRRLISRKNAEFRASLIGSTLSVVTLAGSSAFTTEALSDNFVKLMVEGAFAPNRLLRVRIAAMTPDGLTGVPVSAS